MCPAPEPSPPANDRDWETVGALGRHLVGGLLNRAMLEGAASVGTKLINPIAGVAVAVAMEVVLKAVAQVVEEKLQEEDERKAEIQAAIQARTEELLADNEGESVLQAVMDATASTAMSEGIAVAEGEEHGTSQSAGS